MRSENRIIRRARPWLRLAALALLLCSVCMVSVRGSLAYSYTYSPICINTFTGITEEEKENPETPSGSEDNPSGTGGEIQPSGESGEEVQPSDSDGTQTTDEITGVATPAEESTGSDESGTDNTKTNDANPLWRYVVCIAASAAALVIIWGRGRKRGDGED
ncbi:MAG: hypothetical protein LUC83_07645 [Clostridiales bacterium]|nr:hypothetical protein [Clostridiales bacterium]